MNSNNSLLELRTELPEVLHSEKLTHQLVSEVCTYVYIIHVNTYLCLQFNMTLLYMYVSLSNVPWQSSAKFALLASMGTIF